MSVLESSDRAKVALVKVLEMFVEESVLIDHGEQSSSSGEQR